MTDVKLITILEHAYLEEIMDPLHMSQKKKMGLVVRHTVQDTQVTVSITAFVIVKTILILVAPKKQQHLQPQQTFASGQIGQQVDHVLKAVVEEGKDTQDL